MSRRSILTSSENPLRSAVRLDASSTAAQRWLLLIALLSSACGASRDDVPEKTAQQSWAYEKEFSGGPVSLILRFDRLQAGLADQIVCQQELRLEPGFEADFPEYLREDFEGFAVVHIEHEKPPTPADAKSVASVSTASDAVPLERRKTLILEPDWSGELYLAPLAVYFRRSGEDAESSFMTDEVKFVVSAPPDVGDLTLKDALSIFTAPAEESADNTAAWILAGLLAATAGAAIWLKLRGRGGPKALPPTPPQEIAFDALRRLVALGLIEKGEIERFFVYLSSILREYIENRFAVRAPERTTEEFMREASLHPSLGQHRARLEDFLRVSDRVKFARYEPDAASIQQAFDVVKQFLSETSRDAVQSV